MQNWSCIHLCGHSSIKFLWSCDTRAQDSFFLFKLTQCFQNMLLYQFMHSSESILGVRENFHSIHPLGAYTFFFQKLVMISESLFSKKSWKLFLFKNVLAFQPKDIFSLPLVSFPFKVIIICLSPLFFFLFEQVMRTRAHTTYSRLTTK